MRLIDANALKELILRRSGNMQNTWSSQSVLLAVECQPTVDAVEVVHGRWEQSRALYGYLSCSNCHDVYIMEEWRKDGKWNYCPNCGAKMDGRA